MNAMFKVRIVNTYHALGETLDRFYEPNNMHVKNIKVGSQRKYLPIIAR